MRFSADGPRIPDELLRARDEGRVVFFCGAGVSMARAGLPDFFGLVEAVMHELRAPENCDAARVLEKARQLGKELEVTGLISTDRVFSLLEREFSTTDIHSAVAKCLAPQADVDRSAHAILLRLARTPSGRTQLVTTNFDRLFEPEGAEIPTFQSPRLPQPSRHDDLDGIVYLHGRVDPEYRRADGSDFVLSSADFGRAYLSQGWATEFFRDILRKYVVVFVGYSADDPPVHYLLESLGRELSARDRIYAFQPDGPAELTARWRHKGVEPIVYSDAAGHHFLWDTLEQWAIRADAPFDWRQSVVVRAQAGPRELNPHERGQVAHIVSTLEGAKAFAKAAPPAEWLCVFDPNCRFESPGRLGSLHADRGMIDPFGLYGIDDDETPRRGSDHSSSGKRKVPGDAWDAFAINELDRLDVPLHGLPAVRGWTANHIPALPKRLTYLGSWIAAVANQPAALWWAVRQESLHPSYRREIEWRLSHIEERTDNEIHHAWKYRLQTWNTAITDHAGDWLNLKRELEREGWSQEGVRRFVRLCEPYFSVGPAWTACPVPPTLAEQCQMVGLISIEVECPIPPDDADIPDAWLGLTVRGVRTCLESAARLCEEVDDFQRYLIAPLLADDDPAISDHHRTRGLSGFVISFTELYERLVAKDIRLAQEEFTAWPSDEQYVFPRLRLWATGYSEVATADTFARVVLELSDDVFWGSRHQRDLLLLLARRWSEIADAPRGAIETRILSGPARRDEEADDSDRERVARSVLDRLQWLKTQGCAFACDVDAEIVKRRAHTPNWKPQYAERATESLEMRSGWVKTDREHGALLRVPIGSILSKAQELSGRSSTDGLREFDPYSGLCSERPRRAYLALAYVARKNEYPLWAWNTFLNSDARKDDTASLSAVVARRLDRADDVVLAELLYVASWWLQKVGKHLSSRHPAIFDRITQRLIDVIKATPNGASSALVRSSGGRELVTEAINAPAGHLVRGILEDARFQDVATMSTGLDFIEQCLALPGDPRRHAIVLASHHLGWLHAKVADWTERHLLSILDGDDIQDQEAFWAGFLWNPQVSSAAMFRRIKDGLLTVAKTPATMNPDIAQSLASLLLTGWVSTADNQDSSWISASELRDVLLLGSDNLRSHVLWQFGDVLQRDDADDRNMWITRARSLFSDLWPRQLSVKTPEMSERIVEVLLVHPDSFGALIDVALPLLTTIHNATRINLHFGSEMPQVIKDHPVRFLQLLQVILPDDINLWPYDAGAVLDLIAESDDALRTDSRYIELRRRWDAR